MCAKLTKYTSACDTCYTQLRENDTEVDYFPGRLNNDQITFGTFESFAL